MVASLKEQVLPQDLCDGLPDLFARFLEHARGLAFDEEPDYAGFITKFRNLAIDLYVH